ncbi:MAG: MnhB domain-containing protein [Bacillota bacterium]
MNDVILKTTARLIVPFVQLYGIYIILHGHLTPGGGFAGGALIGTSLILYTLVFGTKRAERKFSHRMSAIAESGGLLLILVIGLVGLFNAGWFLTNLEAGFLKGEAGTLFSAGFIPILMIGIGIKVASTMITLFHTLIEEGME